MDLITEPRQCLGSTPSINLPFLQVDQVADTNGAGDTFATAYMLALQSGWPSPGTFANWAASRAVMMPQDCKPHCVQQGLHANSTFAQVATWLSNKVCSYWRLCWGCFSAPCQWEKTPRLLSVRCKAWRALCILCTHFSGPSLYNDPNSLLYMVQLRAGLIEFLLELERWWHMWPLVTISQSIIKPCEDTAVNLQQNSMPILSWRSDSSRSNVQRATVRKAFTTYVTDKPCLLKWNHLEKVLGQIFSDLTSFDLQLQIVEEETQEAVSAAHGGLLQIWQSTLVQKAQSMLQRVQRLCFKQEFGNSTLR